jgi:hypothetical protein
MPHEGQPALAVLLVSGLARRRDRGIERVRPVALERLQALLELVLAHQPRACPGERAVQDERGRAFRVGGGEERAHRSSFGDPQQRRPLRPRGVHYRANVVHPLLEDRQLVHGHPVGETGPTLVEHDQPAERGEPPEEGGLQGVFPGQFDVRDPAGDEDEVDRSVPDHLVGEVDLAALRVSGLHSHGVSLRKAIGNVNRRTVSDEGLDRVVRSYSETATIASATSGALSGDGPWPGAERA